MTTRDHQKHQSKEISSMKAIKELRLQAGDRMNTTVTGLPDLTAVLDAIDLQLTADSDEVVLPRAAAALVACALHDLLGQPREKGAR